MPPGFRYVIKCGEHEGEDCRPLRASRTKPGWIEVQLREKGTIEVPLYGLESKIARWKKQAKKSKKRDDS